MILTHPLGAGGIENHAAKNNNEDVKLEYLMLVGADSPSSTAMKKELVRDDGRLGGIS